MKETLKNYWGSFESVNMIIMIANVLDPRQKMQWTKKGLERVKAIPSYTKNIRGAQENLDEDV